MRLSVVEVEVATLKATGHEWDGPGGPRFPAVELAAFFALDLDAQLGRLLQSGAPPTPPDVFIRIYAGGELLIETADQKGFDASFSEADGASAEVETGAPLRIEVWDRDVMFHDLIGQTETALPAAATGRWLLDGFGQVRKLVLRLS